ncbi:hypothetical protein AAMO2058_001419100 [Amorphochlora amoebiformis]|eukprot:1359786-Amorphochlora_amoeboformis.AAC.1
MDAKEPWHPQEPQGPPLDLLVESYEEHEIHRIHERKNLYGSFLEGPPAHNDSRQNIAGFLKHEYRRRIRSPLDAGITAIIFLSLLATLIIGVVHPLFKHDSPLSRPLSQILAVVHPTPTNS